MTDRSVSISVTWPRALGSGVGSEAASSAVLAVWRVAGLGRESLLGVNCSKSKTVKPVSDGISPRLQGDIA